MSTRLPIHRRLRSDAIDLTGRRVGRMVVLCPGPVRVSPKGATTRDWWCACDCGERWTTRGQGLRLGHTTECPTCARRTAAARSRSGSIRLPSGRTVADVAKASGLRLDTVYHRLIRGWPEKHLDRPTLAAGQVRPQEAP